MARVTTGIAPSNGIEIAYETHGDPNDEPLLLVMGLGAQLITWPIELVDASSTAASTSSATTTGTRGSPRSSTTARAGWTSWPSSWPPPGPERSRRPTCSPTWPPTASACSITSASSGAHRRGVDGRDDRADDGDRAPGAGAHAHVDHVHHRRCRCRPAHARGDAGAPAAPRHHPRRGDRPAVETTRIISARCTSTRPRAEAGEEAYDRCFNPAGVARQLLGILASGSRPRAWHDGDPHARARRSIRSSPLGRHGRGDPRRRAPRVEDMAHDLPLPLVPQIVDAITSLAARSNAWTER